MKNYRHILIFVFVLGLLIQPTFAASERSISVQGHCLRSAKPNRGSIDFYAESLNQDATKALKDATKSFREARAEIQKMNLKNLELETIENSVQEERVWENNANVFKGYKARVGLKVVTGDIEQIGEIISAVSKSGVKNIGQFVTDMSPSRLKAEQEACLEQAIANAKSKAVKMAKAAGARVGKVLSIQENMNDNGPGPRPMPVANMRVKTMASMEMDSSAPIDVRAQDISMHVNVIYLLE